MKTPKIDRFFDVTGFILAYEAGEIQDEEEVYAGFQELINRGMVWTLQGSYGRQAVQLIQQGFCHA